MKILYNTNTSLISSLLFHPDLVSNLNSLFSTDHLNYSCIFNSSYKVNGQHKLFTHYTFFKRLFLISFLFIFINFPFFNIIFFTVCISTTLIYLFVVCALPPPLSSFFLTALQYLFFSTPSICLYNLITYVII